MGGLTLPKSLARPPCSCSIGWENHEFRYGDLSHFLKGVYPIKSNQYPPKKKVLSMGLIFSVPNPKGPFRVLAFSHLRPRIKDQRRTSGDGDTMRQAFAFSPRPAMGFGRQRRWDASIRICPDVWYLSTFEIHSQKSPKMSRYKFRFISPTGHYVWVC